MMRKRTKEEILLSLSIEPSTWREEARKLIKKAKFRILMRHSLDILDKDETEMAFKYMLHAAGKKNKKALYWDGIELERLVSAIFKIALAHVPIPKKDSTIAYKNIPKEKIQKMMDHLIELKDFVDKRYEPDIGYQGFVKLVQPLSHEQAVHVLRIIGRDLESLFEQKALPRGRPPKIEQRQSVFHLANTFNTWYGKPEQPRRLYQAISYLMQASFPDASVWDARYIRYLYKQYEKRRRPFEIITE